MIESSGQILTGCAATDIVDAIEVVTGADGFHRTKYKAVAAPKNMPVTSSETKGTWAVLSDADAASEGRFLGVVGDDTSPHANYTIDNTVMLNHKKPVLDLYTSRTFHEGDYFTIERNGIIPVIASGAIKEGDLITTAADGKFKKATSAAESVGRAYETVADGEVFRAMIKAL